jgi:hypothetical protein
MFGHTAAVSGGKRNGFALSNIWRHKNMENNNHGYENIRIVPTVKFGRRQNQLKIFNNWNFS